MTIKEYIIKNLPNFNWNILPQIFEENGVEMSEKIEVYLRETPGNTNWSILEQLGGGTKEKLPKIIKITDYGQDESIIANDSDLKTAQEIYNWCENHSKTESSVEEGWSHRIATDIEIYILDVKADFVSAENITPAPSWTAYAGDVYVFINSDGSIVCSYDD